MKIFSKFPTINILKLSFWLVTCIAKNFIWTTLNVIFSIFRFFAPSDSRFSNSCISAKYFPILTNHTSLESLFIQMMYKFQFWKIDCYDCFCGPGSLVVRPLKLKKKVLLAQLSTQKVWRIVSQVTSEATLKIWLSKSNLNLEISRKTFFMFL